MICRKCKKEVPDGKFCLECGANQTPPAKAKRRRGNGQGTVYKRGSSWCCEKTFGFEPKAEGGYRRILARKAGFKTKSEALEYVFQLTDPRLKVSKGTRSTNIFLKDLYDLWLPTHKARKKSTIDCYKAGFKLFRPLWYVSMADMDIDDLQECLDEYTPKRGTSGRRTRENARTCLGLIYKYGMPRGYIPPNASGNSNLANFLTIISGGAPQKEGLSMEELELVRSAIGSVEYADYVYAACYLGFRPSAFLALDASDYDRKEKALRGGIKTEAGINRIVTISPKIQPIIDRLARDKIRGPLFCDANGNAFSLASYRDKFYKILKHVGIVNPVGPNGMHRLTPHSCRHTFATLIKSVAAPDKDKLELIGHTSDEMLRYYQDVSIADLRRITDNI